MAAFLPQRPRAVLDGVLPTSACAELIAAARALAVVGYRDFVCSATILEVAASAPELLPPLVAAREAVRAAVEEALGLPCGLLVEFTGLICWRPGAVIGWHHDANRPYLQQRAYSAVCYLNTAGSDFRGGTFLFQRLGDISDEAAPVEVHALPGRVVAYSAQDVHSITPVTAGERFTLTLWFTEDPAHCEDSRLLVQLAGGCSGRPAPLPASMWVLPDATDLRLCRLAMAGLALVCRGRLLLSAAAAEELADAEGGSPLGVHLAVQPAMLRAWLAWEAAAAAQGAGGAAGAAAVAASPAPEAGEAPPAPSAPSEAAAVVVPGMEFSSVQEGVLAVQHWARMRGSCASTHERVCSTHLCCSPAASDACCAWLRTCRLSSSCKLQEWPAELGKVVGELQVAVAESQQYLARQRAALDALLPRWLQLGAFFHEGAD
ncbi:hypothetical protein ABPG75_006473 [Micractinium tetrahymenae]